jgi:hypothetical protein
MRFRNALFCLIVSVALLGAYASWLNKDFYRHEAPFFDSASYTNYLGWVIGSTRLDGARPGWDIAMVKGTAPLYGIEAFLLAAARAPIASPRQLAVWLQAFWMLALAVSVFLYWANGRRCAPFTAFALTLPFLMPAAVFYYNGGLQDFRLDLSLYVFLASAGAWYLRTYDSPSRWYWLLAGCFLALAGLSRATAPVYSVILFGPLIAIRFFSAGRRVLFRGIGWMLLPFLAVGLPYFLYHFSYLHYYYVEFSKDANANLPLAQSAAHFLYAGKNLGAVLGISAALCALASILRLRPVWQEIDWKLLYLGLAPVLLLMLRGAGLNPFVSMPVIFGWLVFLLAPVKGRVPQPGPLPIAILLAACAWNAAEARAAAPNPHVRVEAFREAIDRMREDSLRRKLPKVDFVTAHNWNFHPQFLRSVLLNEYGYLSGELRLLSPEGTPWIREGLYRSDSLEYNYEMPFTAAVPLVWQQQVHGATDAEKVEWLLGEARTHLDYIFFPDEPTIDFMEKYISGNYINTKTRAIRKRFLESGEWERMGEPLVVTEVERVEMYRKR